MDIPKKIKMLLTYVGMSEAELARKLGTTPQAFSQRMKTGKFSSADLDSIAQVCGARFVCSFELPDGQSI